MASVASLMVGGESGDGAFFGKPLIERSALVGYSFCLPLHAFISRTRQASSSPNDL
jgi:hypothetical protein